jgi:hypothetical protein
MAIETVEDIRGLVSKNGLVVMEFLEDYTPWPAGSKAGFYPKEALALFNQGVAQFALRPNIKPDSRAGISPLAQYVSTKNVPVLATAVSPVASKADVPDNYETLHHLKQFKIAAEIRGVAFGDIKSKDEALQIIREELARREKEKAAA